LLFYFYINTLSTTSVLNPLATSSLELLFLPSVLPVFHFSAFVIASDQKVQWAQKKEFSMKHLLTIAGSDCSGGAGIQADLKTFAALGGYGMSVITAVTVQNTRGVRASQDLRPDIIAGQIEAVFEDIQVDGVKIGMVSRPETILAVSDTLERIRPAPIVLDPVMVSKSGYNLLSPDAMDTLVNRLFPMATMITPNIPEAELITGAPIETIENMRQAAQKLHELGPPLVLVKGGHLSDDATDVLFDGSAFRHFPGKKIQTSHTHGTGCTLSSAITVFLANASPPAEAVARAKAYLTECIANAPGIGSGAGPLNHLFALYRKAGMTL
jgi:hydroxymethylpyrimidine/phosphomethylpyrimidine kinase